MISSLLAFLALVSFSPSVPDPAVGVTSQQKQAVRQDKVVLSPQSALAVLARKHADRMQLEEWGRSRADHPLLIARVAFPGAVPAGQRPAILLVAGLDGRRTDDSAIAMEQLVRILEAAPDSEIGKRLSRTTLYVHLMANPDGLARGIAGNGAPEDSDHDGSEGEDGPDDIDGDGRILWMRWKDPEGTWIEDPDHAGLMREADPKKNERGVYRLEREGADNDGDHRYNEDAPGGVMLQRNFAQLYPEHGPGAGPYVLSEPESLALARFVTMHPRLQLVVTYGANDNLLEKPVKNTLEGRRAPTGYMEKDLWIQEELGKLYREKTGREGKNVDEWPGRFHSWAYAHGGLPSLATSLSRWSDKPAKSAETKPAKEQAAEPGKEAPGKAGDPAKKVEETERSRQRAWLVKHWGDRAFVAWKGHPLPAGGLPGRVVEIGGLDTSLLHRIPESEKERIAASHLEFLMALLDRMPEVRLGKVSSRKLGANVLEVEALVSNEGWLPPRIHMATLLRRPVLPRAELVLGSKGDWKPLLPAQDAAAGATALIRGPRMTLLSQLAGKGSHETLRWTIRLGTEGPPTLLIRQGDHVLGSLLVPINQSKNGGGR